MTNYYFNIGLIYFIIGFGVALFFYFIIRKEVLGRFWGALAICVVGSYIGGLFDFLLHDLIQMLANFNNSINLFPPLITSFLIVMFFAKVSGKNQ